MFFIYKNRSSKEFGIKIVSINNLSSPQRKTEKKEVPGRKAGDLIIDYGSYGNFPLKIVCTLNAQKKDIESVVTDLKYWLQGEVGFSDLYISETGKNYKACCINKLDIAEVFKNFGECTLIFECQPYKQFTDNDLITITKTGAQIYNQYFESLPYMKIYGTGDVTIFINNQTLVLKDISDYIEVDSEEMNCFKGANNNTNDQMYTDFPVLYHGENTISWVGNITKIELNPRWCSL